MSKPTDVPESTKTRYEVLGAHTLHRIGEMTTELTQDLEEDTFFIRFKRIPAASPVAPPESELDKEITRWQKAIYDLCREESGDDTIDGGGCDSGDPLDFTLSEISEAFGIIKDKLASPVAGGSARIAEIAARVAAEMRKHPVAPLACDAAYLLRLVTGELAQPQGEGAAEKIATLTKLNGEQLLLNNKLLFEVIPALQSRVEAALEVLRRPGGRGPMQFYNAQQVDELLAEAIAKLENSAEGWVKVTPETMPKEGEKWECFPDSAYYDMWAVRPVADRRFEAAFHVSSKGEAEALCAMLTEIGYQRAEREGI